jgi:hypothetical protein
LVLGDSYFCGQFECAVVLNFYVGFGAEHVLQVGLTELLALGLVAVAVVAEVVVAIVAVVVVVVLGGI